MASKEVNLCSEEWLRRDLQASCPQLGDIKVSYFVRGLPRCGFPGSPGRLPVSFAALLRLALSLSPVLLSARPWFVLVLFPCALLPGTRACAQLLPDRQGDRHPVSERTCRVAGATAQGDSGLQPVTGRGPADRRPHMPAVPVRITRARAGPPERVETGPSLRHCEAPLPARSVLDRSAAFA
jgi:hypothetical protein